MILQSLRPALLSVFAILFGVVQIFCVCANAAATTPTQASHEVHQSAETGFGLAHSMLSHGTAIDVMPDNGGEHKHDGEHEHAADCAHCDDASVLVSNDVISPVSLPTLADEDFIVAAVQPRPITRALMAPSALDGLRWLHPPTPTLVSLKIRLTI